MEQGQRNDKEYYDSIPVYYCKNCGSLKIMAVDDSMDYDYCDECGSADIGKASIEGWMLLQETQFGNTQNVIKYGRERKERKRALL